MNDDELDLFKQAMQGVKPLSSDDKVQLSREQKLAQQRYRSRRREQEHNQRVKENAYFAFSDAFQAHFDTEGPLKYVRDTQYSDELKRIRRGDYVPEWVLDLHGLNREDAKQELAAILYQAKQKHVSCVCIVHGIGSGILKQQVPSWLIQHPDVIAFHQATLEWGGKGALLVLIDHPFFTLNR